MSTGAEKCEFVTTASRNKLFRPSAAHDSLVFWAGRIEAKRLTMVLIVGWPAFGAESRRRLMAWRRPTWRVWDEFVSTFTHRRAIRQWPAAPVCRYEAPRAKNRSAAAGTRHFFSRTIQGRKKKNVARACRHIRHIRPCRHPSARSRAGCPDGVRGSPHISPISCPVPSMKHGLRSYPSPKSQVVEPRASPDGGVIARSRRDRLASRPQLV